MNTWSAALAPAIQVCGWTLLHSLWQGALIAAAYAALRGSMPRGNARYALGLAALVALALIPLWTAWQLATSALPKGSPVVLEVMGRTAVATTTSSDGRLSLTAATNTALPWLVLTWWLGVSLQAWRALREWQRLRDLLRRAVPLPAWQARFGLLQRRLGLRGEVLLLGSGASIAPLVVGWLRPVVLLPLAVASGFPPAEVELILAHELAHIRRLDPLVNLLQVALETLQFYHPAVHWISRDVRREREVCCDALALTASGDARRNYLAALLRLEQSQSTPLVLAASGGVLLERAQLIAGFSQSRRTSGAALRLTLPLLLLLAAAAVLQWPHDRRIAQAGIEIPATLAAPPRPIWIWPRVSMPLTPPPRLHLQASMLATPATPAAAAPTPTPTISAMPAKPAATAETASAPPSPRSLPAAVPGDVASPPIAQADTPPASAAPATPPRVLHVQQPVYPDLAARRGIEGRVVLEFALGTDGRVRDARVVSADPAGVFDDSALAALRGWRFAPPAAAAAHARYRQALEFALTPAREGAQRTLPAVANCRIVTGSHICRSPETDANADLTSVSRIP
jgi:TonB family protein